ncbi:putative RNA binding protein Tma22 [Aspergillus clavatus NRRL 1]|uniref:Translation machinery-associated protein 22 n=1 Tax=Aspergillus clavatus (strain ATCC 1007 / CBS 513.65 / DSM 816 / NCTC 3887 / NRRL 1 / QM 1276 / 107) TaxID=344612 RepID=DENR_ASPCL|nr:RNA binding protein Tma22, putative [Aspergillus clavatus NRRL 1]A1C8E3.1 RecName: Full=Translation machinery-associated protein 22 [Aspergillus clavatus NRRL 1]EAW13580.1 RNA binding protein Tma22, putative [Aspergillus clavatus NRRL 1]
MGEIAQPAFFESKLKQIVYCGVCTLPPEYCEFGGTAKKCEEWLKDNHEETYQRLYSEEALSSNLSTLSVSVRERAAKDAAKKEAKAALAEARDAERKAAAKVQIKRVERNKRKHVTVITGLEVHGLENKKVAKELGKKFATGSSVTKSPAGVEEITVQGDVSEDVQEWLLEVYGKELPESNIELVEDKKKKSSS